jgi:hypothetical protein
MNKSAAIIGISAMFVCLFTAGCSAPSSRPQSFFDTSYTAPWDWKVVDEPLWGIRLNVPPSVRATETTNNLWIHDGTKLRLIIDFGSSVSPKSLKVRPNYSETRLTVNGLPALVCTYDKSASAAAGSLNKVVALFFLESRKSLGGGGEPSYRVEYASDAERTTAFQILQTVRFYNS